MQKSEGQPRQLAQGPRESMAAPQADPTQLPGASTLTLQSHRGAAKALGENACPGTASARPTSPGGATRRGDSLRQQAWASGPRVWALEVTYPLASSLEPHHTQPGPGAGDGVGQWSVAQTRQARVFED